MKRSARTRRLAASALAVVALAVSTSCSLIVPSEVDPLHCSQEGKIGPPACEPDQICADGICVKCMPKEICGDGIDNDCNGVVDDGCSSEAPSCSPRCGGL
jgi:hypothetical protein